MRILAILFWCMLLLLPVISLANAQSMDQASSQIIEQLKKKNVKSVAVLNFVDINDRVRGLGKYLAEDLSISMVGNEAGIGIVDRANLKRIMEELQLSESVLVDPKNAKQLGELSGADVLVFGTLAKTGGSYSLQIRGVSVATAEVLTATRMRLNLDEDFNVLWESVLGSGGTAGIQSGSSRSHREHVKSNRRFEVTLLNLTTKREKVGTAITWYLSASFITKNLTDSATRLQFPSDGALAYHGQDGTVCAHQRQILRNFHSNLNISGYISGFDPRDVQVVGPREELMVNVSGLRCSAAPKDNTGHFAIRMFSSNDDSSYNNENFSFRDVEIALGK